jgi:hypothetical protein
MDGGGCFGRFRCRARSLGRCVMVVWRMARGCLASCPEPCVLCVCLLRHVCVSCVCSCLCLLRHACGVLFLLGYFICAREKKQDGNDHFSNRSHET